MGPYAYQALPVVPSIRLIQLEPLGPRSQSDGTITCSFTVATIAALPPYTALSYVWGDSSDPCSILIDGKSRTITRSLADALQRLAKGPGRLLWADALCINQADDDEKSKQVNMMATIYSKATKVAVCLGPDSHNDAPSLFLRMQRTVDAYRIIAAAAARVESGSSDPFTDDAAVSWVQDLGSDGSPLEAITNPQGDDKERVIRFFRLPWFTRTWTLQEAGLASEAEMIWGEHTIPWHTVGLMSMVLSQGHLQLNLDRLGIKTEVERVFHAYTAYSPLIPSATFLHVINHTRRFSATNPQDKLYAFLSHPTASTGGRATEFPTWSAYEAVLPVAIRLLNNYQDRFLVRQLAQQRRQSGTDRSDDPLPPPFIQADYTKSAEQVYHEFALHHIAKTNSLEILSTVQHDPTSTLPLFSPSWVPRWDYFVDTPTLGLYNSRHLAAANKPPIITPSPDVPNSLRVRGHLFSRIIYHSPLLSAAAFDLPLPEHAKVGPDSPVVQALWSKNPISDTWGSTGLIRFPANSYPVLPMLFTADGAYSIVDQRAANLFQAYMRTWVAGKNLSETDGFDLQADADAYWHRLWWGTEGEHQDDAENAIRWKRFRNSAARVCNQRRFFITERGLFGVGPGAMKRDDFVAVLLGLDVPVVLREVEEEGEEPSMAERKAMNMLVPMDRKFLVVGECYVDGLMQGQLARQEFARDITLI